MPMSMPMGAPISSVWSEHKTDDGRAYYFNRETNETTYEKPDALKTPAERSLGKCPWTEHKGDGGRTYYFNTETQESVWEEPEELTKYKAALAQILAQQQQQKQQAAAAVTSAAAAALLGSAASSVASAAAAGARAKAHAAGGAGGSKGGKGAGGGGGKGGAAAAAAAAAEAALGPGPDWKPADSQAGQIADFRAMLTQRGVNPDLKWQDIVAQIERDPRFEALSAKGLRKQTWAEWTNTRRKELVAEQRVRGAHAREALVDMLSAHPKPLSSGSYEEAEAEMTDEPRWWAVEDEAERRRLFADWAERALRDEAARVQKRMREQETALEALLARDTRIGLHSTWAEVKDMLAGEPAFEQLPRTARLDVFKRFIERVDREDKERQRRSRAEAAARRRDAVSALIKHLEQATEAGRLHYRSQWADEREAVLNSDVGQALAAAFNDSPDAAPMRGSNVAPLGAEAVARDEFERHCAGLDKLWSVDCRTVESEARSAGIALHEPITLADFLRRLRSGPAPSPMTAPGGESEEREGPLPRPLAVILASRPGQLRLAFDRVRAVAETDERDRRARIERNLERFRDLLMDYFFRSDHLDTTWEEARDLLRERSAYKALDRDDRIRLFDEHMTELRRRAEQSRQAREERRRLLELERLQQQQEQRRQQHEQQDQGPASGDHEEGEVGGSASAAASGEEGEEGEVASASAEGPSSGDARASRKRSRSEDGASDADSVQERGATRLRATDDQPAQDDPSDDEEAGAAPRADGGDARWGDERRPEWQDSSGAANGDDDGADKGPLERVPSQFADSDDDEEGAVKA